MGLLAYPFPLPAFDPAWGTWNDGTVVKLATMIADEKKWELIPILADAMEEAGCGDPEIMHHLRDLRHTADCWFDTCWVCQALLARPQRVMAVEASPDPCREVLLGGVWDADKYIPVINAGDWFGVTWLVSVAAGYDAVPFVGEADYASDAMDVFAADETYGHMVRIDVAADGEDYGWQDGDTWYNLHGTAVPGPLEEPHWTGDGRPYTTDDLYIDGDDVSRSSRGYPVRQPWACNYFGPGLPLWGLSPLEYANPERCGECGKDFYTSLGVPDARTDVLYCSAVCRDAATDTADEDDACP